MSKWLLWLLTLLLVSLGGPWVTLAVDTNDAMLILMVLLFVFHPLCAAYSGILAGGNVRKQWWLPLVHGILFAVGAWWILSMDVQGLYVYSPIYLTIGLVAMGITAVIRSGSRKKKAEGCAIMKRWMCRLCACVIVCLAFVGCGSDVTHNVISCTDVIATYEQAGYAVWHKEYPEGERDYVCEVSAENEDGDAIYFTFYDSAEKATAHAEESRWNLLLWAYSLVSGDPTWVHTEAYDTIAIQYENADIYTPFEELK